MNFQEILKAFNLAQLGGRSSCVTPDITTTATQYSSGDSIGGVITLKDVMYRKNGTSILKSIFVRDNVNQISDLTILFFNSPPSATDNSAFSYGTSFLNQIGKVNILSTDYQTINSKAVADIDTMSKVLQSNNDSTDLYAVIISNGTPTYGAGTNNLNITFSFLID